jgi:DNA-binding PadR family transcriptional regulator
VIQAANFPRPSEREELLLRLVGEVSSTASELVERSGDRIAVGGVYDTLARMVETGWVKRQGRWYTITVEGRSLIRARDGAERIYQQGLAGG